MLFRSYPREFYAIAAKLIPMEISAQVKGTLNVTIEEDASCDPIKD